LVGRACEITAVRKKLLTGRAALVGLPGVGKTTLALELASDVLVRTAFPGGILWADVGHPPNLDGILRSWCKILLEFSPQKMARLTQEKLLLALQAALSDQKVCLILDDVWASIDARTLLQIAGPNCGVLITTRFPMIAADLVGDDPYTLRELDESDGLHLLRLLAHQAVEMEPEKVRELVRAVGGLPLALTLMGRYLASEAISGQARRIVRALEHLSDARERLDTGERSLRSVISLSENLLAEAERSAFHALGLLPPKPGSFSEHAALAVAGCTTEVLDTLVDLGLLEPTGKDYRFHQTISDYAQAMLSPTEHLLAEERLLTSILDALATKAVEPGWLEQEKQTILLAIDAADH
ncbi:MAG: NB-ARC domain-containing protein, partial [Ktedonobacteraceae bacterium]